jgi:hypothetical protein
VSPVKYELGFYIPGDGILHSDRRENLKTTLISNVLSSLHVQGSWLLGVISRHVCILEALRLILTTTQSQAVQLAHSLMLLVKYELQSLGSHSGCPGVETGASLVWNLSWPERHRIRISSSTFVFPATHSFHQLLYNHHHHHAWPRAGTIGQRMASVQVYLVGIPTPIRLFIWNIIYLHVSLWHSFPPMSDVINIFIYYLKRPLNCPTWAVPYKLTKNHSKKKKKKTFPQNILGISFDRNAETNVRIT